MINSFQNWSSRLAQYCRSGTKGALVMEQPTQSPQPVVGAVSSANQLAFAMHQPAAMISGAPAVIGTVPSFTQLTTAFPPIPAQIANQNQLTYQQAQQFPNQQQQQQQLQLQTFWANQMSEIEKITDFKNYRLPLARIKKIMKADEDVRMISAEAPVVFAKACEIFILELTLRSWIHTEENKRRTLQKNDIAAAITRSDIFDFLVDIIPRDELKDEGLVIPRVALPAIGAPSDSLPYYYVPAQHQVPAPGMIMSKPVDQTASAAMFASQQLHPVTYMWQQPQVQPEQHQRVPEDD